MLQIIHDPIQINKSYKKLVKQLLPVFNERITCTIGYHGGSFSDTVNYSKSLGLWYSTWEHNGVVKNLFGHGRPSESSSNSMTGQINIPTQDQDRSIAGAFAISEEGAILLVHRGNIGGGKAGIGKSAFLENFRGDLEDVDERGIITQFCVIGELGSPLLPVQIKNFLNEVRRIKSFLSSPSTFDMRPFRFNDEKDGSYILGNLRRDRNANRTHYLIVNALAQLLEKQGCQVGNDRNRDLFIFDSKKITVLFEIKSAVSTNNLYSAVGQLLVYSIPISNPVKLILVLPDHLESAVEKKLKRHGIDLLYITWSSAQEPIFPMRRLNQLLRR